MKATPKPLKKRKIQNETKRDPSSASQSATTESKTSRSSKPPRVASEHSFATDANGDAPRQKRHHAPSRERCRREREKTRAFIDSFARANVLRAKVKETKKKRWNKRGRTEERQARGRTRIRLFWWRRSVVASRTLKKKKKKFPFLSKPKGVTFIWDSKKITGLYIHASTKVPYHW